MAGIAQAPLWSPSCRAIAKRRSPLPRKLEQQYAAGHRNIEAADRATHGNLHQLIAVFPGQPAHTVAFAVQHQGDRPADIQFSIVLGGFTRGTDDPQILMTKCGTYDDAKDFIAQQKQEPITYGVTHLGNIDDVSAFMFATNRPPCRTFI